ncbi:MAG: FAD-dependent oxidoreductase [Eubacteriaceae bacterium]|uniref:FAD-dependent oxidoreductase n=1 Tax=Candidatus Pseudoramibacter fermentans TaxID=2594427 RepID=A0A6L5GPT7_9FIRM|nr:FAD-dependent oxidoreductase [Candidatus Pseudoramibacter fermentans]RRF92037.1 MAG: FAD-dependent oxidoreductase [Eubacteriaceae bacterium]
MIEKKVDCVVIGGGPAGLAAAIEADKQGLDTLIIERDVTLGGILQQCIHDGFGLDRFKKRMTGGQYAQRFIDVIKERKINVLLNTMVLDITPSKEIYASSPDEGMLHINAKSIILAMGCRERTRSQVLIYGDRPAGVLTAGAVQRYINMEGYLPGKKAVILGSGDIGLIMARRMTLEGIKVEGVYEIMHRQNGLTRNVVQCLKDYNIPLHLGTTVKSIHDKKRIHSVTVVEVDKNLKEIPGTERDIDCDLLVLSVGLIPENELSEKAQIEIDPVTKGPIVDSDMMTSIPGIFAAGNVATVFDLVDYVSQSGEIAARGAAKYVKHPKEENIETIDVHPGNNVAFVFPQKIRKKMESETFPIFMRVKNEACNVATYLEQGGNKIKIKKHLIVKPPEMIREILKTNQLDLSSDLTIHAGE